MWFSWYGMLIVLATILPSLLYVSMPPQNMPKDIPDGGPILRMLEQYGRLGYLAMMAFWNIEYTPAYTEPLFFATAGFLLLYYAMWIRYHHGRREYALLYRPWLFIPLPMAVFPVCASVLGALWLHNLPALIAAVLFGVGHVMNSSYMGRVPVVSDTEDKKEFP